MDLSTITVADFKAQFFRDFPYLPNWNSSTIYNIGDIVYYQTTNLFYKSLVNGNTNITPGSDGTKWTIYPDTLFNYVLDQDITNAFAEAQIVFNQALYADDADITLAYLYLTAHWLCNDLQAAASGINSSAAFPTQSKSAGSVSESYAIPKAYTESAILAQYTSSRYGMKYLALTLPNLVGNMAPVIGGANP